MREDYGWRPDTAGLAIVFTGYPAATARWPHAAKATLEIMARASHDAVTPLRRVRLERAALDRAQEQ